MFFSMEHSVIALGAPFCESAQAMRSIPLAGRRNPTATSIWSSFSAGWPTHMSRVLPKSGGALCDVQGYERPALAGHRLFNERRRRCVLDEIHGQPSGGRKPLTC